MENMTEQDLERMVAFVGLKVRNEFPSDIYPFHVKISGVSGGRVSRGCGDTRKDAILNALPGQNIHWESVREKMFEKDCKGLMRL